MDPKDEHKLGHAGDGPLPQGEKPLSAAHGHKLAVPTKERLHYLDHGDLIALQASGSYTWVHHGKGERLLVSRNLANMAGGLPCPPFFRCHRAHVINLAKVEELQRHGGYRVLLKHGLVLAVARARWSLLLVLMDLL